MSGQFHVGTCLVLLIAGCGTQAPTLPNNTANSPPPASSGYGYGGYGDYGTVDSASIVFKDDVASQPAPMTSLVDLELTTIDGEPQTLRDLLNGQNLIVVITRGYSGAICPYCSTQTSRLIANYKDIQSRQASVVVIHPLQQETDRPRVPEFLARVNEINTQPATTPTPFPFLIDVGLKTVDALAIRKDLSKPATYILDRTGAVRFAYVGETLADRPSMKALLQQLDAINAEAPATTSVESASQPSSLVSETK